MFRKGIVALLIMGLLVGSTFGTDVIIQQKRVIFDPNYFVGAEGYYKVGEQIKQEKEEINLDKLDRILSNLEILIKLLGQAKGGVTPPVVPVPQPEPEPVPEPDDNLDPVTKRAHEILKARCYNCHKRGSSNGFEMFDKDGKVSLSLPQVVNVHYRVEGLGFEPGTTLMPKGGAPLSNDDMLTIKKWLKLEADNTK